MKYQVTEDISKLLIQTNPSPNFGWLLGYQDDSLVQITSLCRILNQEGDLIKVINTDIIKQDIGTFKFNFKFNLKHILKQIIYTVYIPMAFKY